MTIATKLDPNLAVSHAKECFVTAELDNTCTFRFFHLIKILKEFAPTCTFHFCKDRLYIRFLDPNHTTLLDFSIPAEFWAEYSCYKETTITVELDLIYRSLFRFSRLDDSYKLRIYEKLFVIRMPYISIYIEGNDYIDENDNYSPPKTPPRISLELFDIEPIKKIIEDQFDLIIFRTERHLDHYSLHIGGDSINPTKEWKTFTSKGSTPEIQVRKNWATPLNPLLATYSRHYLLAFLKVAFDCVYTIEYDTDSYMILTAELGWRTRGETIVHSYLRMYIAPRITESEDRSELEQQYYAEKEQHKEYVAIWQKVADDTKSTN